MYNTYTSTYVLGLYTTARIFQIYSINRVAVNWALSCSTLEFSFKSVSFFRNKMVIIGVITGCGG